MNPVDRIGPVKPPLGGPAGIRRRQRPARDSNEDQRKPPERDTNEPDGDEAPGRQRIDELA